MTFDSESSSSDEDGYDRDGYDREGYDRDGYDKDGWNARLEYRGNDGQKEPCLRKIKPKKPRLRKIISVDPGFPWGWSLNDSVREEIQNLRDGAIKYIEHTTGSISVPRPLFLSESPNDPWVVNFEYDGYNDVEVKLNNKIYYHSFRRTEFGAIARSHTSKEWYDNELYRKRNRYRAYESSLLLVSPGCDMDRKDALKILNGKPCESNQTNKWKNNWHKIKEAVGFLQVTYLVDTSRYCNNKRWIEFGQVEESILVKLVAENRVVPGFCIDDNLFRIGSSTKTDDANAHIAGTYGEGSKCAASVAVAAGYRVRVEANGLKREYERFDEDISGTRKVGTKNLPSNIISLTMEKHPDHDFYSGTHTFDHKTFQLLAPGRESPVTGEIMIAKSLKGTVYCKGIRVEQNIPNILFGYSLVFTPNRDRSTVGIKDLKKGLSQVWARFCQDGQLMRALLNRLLQEESPSKFAELQTLADNKDLLRALIKVFQEKEGCDAYPCMQSEVKQVSRLFSDNKKSVVIQDEIVKLFRTHGDYKEVEDEHLIFFNQNNPSKKNVKNDPSLQKIIYLALKYLNNIESDNCPGESNLFFIDGTSICDDDDRVCKFIEGIYYIHDCLLDPQIDTNDKERAYRLGLCVAMQLETDSGQSFHIKYAMANRNNQVGLQYCISAEELDSNELIARSEIQIQISAALVKQHPQIQIIHSQSQREVLQFKAKQTIHLKTVERNSDYYINAIEPDTGTVITDPESGVSCTCMLKTRGYTDHENKAAAVLIQNFTRCVAARQRVKSLRGKLATAATNQCDTKSLSSRSKPNACQKFASQLDVDCPSDDEALVAGFNDNDPVSSCDEDATHNLPTIFDEEDEVVDNFLEDEYDDMFSTQGSLAIEEPSDLSSDEEEISMTPKRRKVFDPNSSVVEFRGQQFDRLTWYMNDTEKVYCNIIQFRGKTIATRALCEIVKPFEKSFAGKGETTSSEIYVKLEEYELSLNAAWLADSHEIDVGLVPKHSYLYCMRGRHERVKDNELICSYEPVPEIDSYGVPDTPNVLEEFAGVGGMSIGLERAGLKIAALVEKNQLAAASLRKRHPGKVYPEDINLFHEKAAQGLYSHVDASHRHTSPPCTGTSGANRNLNVAPTNQDLENRKLSDTVSRGIDIFDNLTLTMENVDGMLYKDMPRLQAIIRQFLESGYSVLLALHNSKYYGDPQSRKRLFLYASKIGMPSLPERTHTDETALTTLDALSDLQKHEPQSGAGEIRFSNRVSFIGSYFNEVTSIFNHTLSTQTYTESNKKDFKKLDPNKPAPTIRTSNKLLHPILDRPLTLRELARLQGFPDDIEFSGSPTAIRVQIGNAVPVGLATAVGKAIMKLYNDYDSTH